MQSFHTFPSPISLITSHKLLLHLKPAPKLTMNTLSPFLSLFLASMYPNTYQMLLADVFPNRCSVILAGSTSYSLRLRLVPMPSMTAFPPVCTQKWSTPVLKFTFVFGAPVVFSEELPFIFRARFTTINLTSSLIGKILGDICLRLSARARVAAFGRVLPRFIPTLPCSSSFCMQQP
ncbi:hypothetical protein CIPAW_13G101500 [Carya illinoinensis]|uniref:Uncharacterized protein n=1 Tax=Carya illinoinensis TaxID=32201 RepID=A0A8T1NQX8_CARIL|nr:hypothetical protein CIPAW_13G101500 [Carya illinoinensis]